MVAGKMTANKNPTRSPGLPDTGICAACMIAGVLSAVSPTSQGPSDAPISPAEARMANMDVPASGNLRVAMTMVPGHSRLTPKPLNAHAASERAGKGEKTTADRDGSSVLLHFLNYSFAYPGQSAKLPNRYTILF